ncbi:MAG: transketolase C-terminal domain-containing protein, partial [Clostridiales bacterium]|nr:transketolase C-terminal domain-containing protein [Clostridiales bacterium]
GLSLTGKIAFINSFAVFTTGRNYDQLRQSICTANLNVKINGSSAGLSDFGDGATHQSVEDIAIMRALPNMTVLVPADGLETKKAVEATVNHDGPVYIRITRSECDEITPMDQVFTIGQPYVLREGHDVAIFACGIMVQKSIKAAEKLADMGISARVVNVSSLKPLDEDAVKYAAEGVKGVITAEEHSVIGGLTAAIAYILRGRAIPLEPVAIMDKFGQSAQSLEELLEFYGLTQQDIVKAAVNMLQKK